jgi:hypothetical protein
VPSVAVAVRRLVERYRENDPYVDDLKRALACYRDGLVTQRGGLAPRLS